MNVIELQIAGVKLLEDLSASDFRGEFEVFWESGNSSQPESHLCLSALITPITRNLGRFAECTFSGHHMIRRSLSHVCAARCQTWSLICAATRRPIYAGYLRNSLKPVAKRSIFRTAVRMVF